MHIPKTAGTSFSDDFVPLLRKFKPDSNFVYHSDELCYSYFHHSPAVVTLLRQPGTHVLSQYWHCMTSRPHRKSRKEWTAHIRYAMGSFGKWIRYWNWTIYERFFEPEGLEPCYSPYNMQTRYFTCNGVERDDAHFFTRKYAQWAEDHNPLEVALERMRSLRFVGLSEAYHESVCAYLILFLDEVPEVCNCADQAQWGRFRGVHKTHWVKPHALSDYSKEDLKVLADITKDDTVLYNAAVEKFVHDIQRLEARYHTNLTCGNPQHILDNQLLDNQQPQVAVQGELLFTAHTTCLSFGILLVLVASATQPLLLRGMSVATNAFG